MALQQYKYRKPDRCSGPAYQSALSRVNPLSSSKPASSEVVAARPTRRTLTPSVEAREGTFAASLGANSLPATTEGKFYVDAGAVGCFHAQFDQTAMIPRAARKFTVTELFAGAGIWSKAMSDSQLQGIAFAESDPIARAAFKSNYGGIAYDSVEDCLQYDNNKPLLLNT